MEAPGFVPAFSAALNAYLAFGGAGSLLRPTASQNHALFREVASAVPVRSTAHAARRAGSGSRKAATA